MTYTTHKGFTLIELLVVIAVIGMLASVVLVALGPSKAKARDARRIQDLRAIQTALELYFNDRGEYPPVHNSNGCTFDCGCTSYDCNGYTRSYNAQDWNAFAQDLAPYLSRLPTDPINANGFPWLSGNFSYTYGNVGKTTYAPQYDLTGQLEDPNNPLRCGVKDWRTYFNNSLHWCQAFGGEGSNQVFEASPQNL